MSSQLFFLNGYLRLISVKFCVSRSPTATLTVKLAPIPGCQASKCQVGSCEFIGVNKQIIEVPNKDFQVGSVNSYNLLVGG